MLKNCVGDVSQYRCTESDKQKMCNCPNTYGLDCMCGGGGGVDPITEHKDLSVRPISITKSPWFVLEACSPFSRASLTPTPSPSRPPSCPHWAANTLWCSHLIHCVCECTSWQCQPRITPQTGACASERSNTLLPCQAACSPVELSLSSYSSPLLIPLETGWRPKGMGVGRGWDEVRWGGASGGILPKLCQMNLRSPSMMPPHVPDVIIFTDFRLHAI